MKKVLSGIRATGRLHLGNYLGAVKGMVDLQNDSGYKTYYMVADLHSITTPYNKDSFSTDVKSVVLDYISCGLDPKKSTIFVQSMVPAHTELFYYFSSVVNVAKMQHLPTFKEKVKQHPKNVTMALLNYPVLMAADILVYKATHVPVGRDQEPHLEVAREIARKMNSLYGTDFPEPKTFSTKGKYVASLTGEGKMSKSVAGSAIFLSDTFDQVKEKVAKIPTDSGKGSSVPKSGGVASFLQLVEIFMGEDKRKEFEQAYKSNFGLRYKDAKQELSQAVYQFIEPIQNKRSELEKNPDYIDKVIKEGAIKARQEAEQTINMIKDRMGFLRY